MEENKGRNKGYANLKPCKPGETNNPNGRPKGQRNFATIYKEAMNLLAQRNNTTPEALEAEMVANAALLGRKGNYNFYKDTLDRLHGQATSNVAVKGNVIFSFDDSFKE